MLKETAKTKQRRTTEGNRNRQRRRGCNMKKQTRENEIVTGLERKQREDDKEDRRTERRD